MDNSHRKKILCVYFDTYSEAKAFAKEVSLLIVYPIENGLFIEKIIYENGNVKTNKLLIKN